MTVIRDEQFFGVLMIPLLQQHNITRCNVDSCEEKPSTVIKDCVHDSGDIIDFALCEKHYQEAKQKGRIEYKLTFDVLTNPIK